MIHTQKTDTLFTDIPRQRIIILSILAFLPVCIFYITIFLFVVNIPYWDDYDAILGFTNNYLESNFKNKITLIFSQHNEHRIVFNRIITLLNYYLSGKINFRFLTLIGNISLLGLLIVLFKSFMFSKNKNKFLYFIPAIFMLFQPQYWGTIYFATPSLSNLYILFFAFLSLYFLTKRTIKLFLFSLLLAIFATFTNGNGILVFFAGLLPLLYQKRYKEIILWLLAGIGCVFFYFYGYAKPSHHPSIIASIFITPVQTIIYFFIYIGLCFLDFGFKYGKNIYFLPFFLGMLCFLYSILLIKTNYCKKNIVIASFLLFLFLTGIVVSLCRSGFNQGLPSRYKITSVLFLILSYLSIMEITPQKIINRIFPVLLVFSILFNLFLYYKNYDFITLQKKYLIDGLTLWRNESSGLSYPDEVRANLIMANAISKKYYSPPGTDSLGLKLH